MARGRAANGSGMQPRKRSDGRWEARFSAGIDPGTGKVIMKSVYGRTSAEVAEKLRKYTSEVDQNNYLDPSKTTVAEWMTVWLRDYAAVGVKDSTFSQYESYNRLHITPGLGAVQLCKLQPNQVQHWVNNLKRKDNSSSDKLSRKTVKNIHGCLSIALKKAKELRMIKDNPAENCVLPKKENNPDESDSEEMHPLDEKQITSFRNVITGSRFETIFRLALLSGMRLSEILGLRWSRIDFTNSRIKIDSQLLIRRKAGEPYKLGIPKNSKTRTIKVPHEVIELLRHQQIEQKKLRLAAGSVWNNSLDLCFTDEIGNCIPHSRVEHDFKKYAIQIDYSICRFHDLRHTFAVRALERGVDIKTLSVFLGHSSVAFTLDRYGHVSERMENQLSNIISQMV